MQIGPYTLANPLILAPMTGITDLPFRQLCRQHGAALAVSEMVTADTRLWKTAKSRLRLYQGNEPEPRSIQIAGADPHQLAEAAKQCVDRGADIVDINMGCPAKKVCNVLAGSSLLKDEKQVGYILDAVVNAVNIPVTLKIRTGWDQNTKNGLRIAQIAENCGIQALAVHGRTRADRFTGQAEYETIRLIKQHVEIPVFANGDITSVEKALTVLNITQADGLLIGRAAQGNPWIFQQINHALSGKTHYQTPPMHIKAQTILQHLQALHEYYGEQMGVRIARKHLAWYFKNKDVEFWKNISRVESAEQQYKMTQDFIEELIYKEPLISQPKQNLAA